MEKCYCKRRANTRMFLSALELKRKIGEVGKSADLADEVDYNAPCAVRPSDPTPYDHEISKGQVRLLAKTERLTYIAVLKKWDDASWLVAPFSAFSSSATEGELIINENGGIYLSVLEIWNARTLHTISLRSSWLVGNLSERKLADALALLGASMRGNDVAERILANTALPIYREDDPRLEYKQGELANFAEIDRRDEQLVAMFDSWANLAATFPRQESELCLAAGDAQEDRHGEWCATVGEQKFTLAWVFDSETKRILITVFDAEGSVSSALEGWVIVSSKGEDLLAINGGQGEAASESFGEVEIALFNPKDGSIAQLDPQN